MPIHRYPILIWEDQSGFFTAAPVEDLDDYGDADEPLAGTGPTEKAAKDQLASLLEWLAKENDEAPESVVTDLSWVEFAVTLRPEEAQGHRVFPCPYSIRLPFVCAFGGLSGEVRMGSVPALGIWFRYFDGDPVKELTVQRIRGFFKEAPLERIARFQPPRSWRADTVTIKTRPTPSGGFVPGPEHGTLAAVAEPLDAASGKRRYPPALERETEVADLVKRIREEKANVLLVGEGGSGKTVVLADAVRRISHQDRSGTGPRFWRTGGQRLIAGMKYLGQWERRCESLIEELAWVDGVLCVDNALELVRTGGVGPEDSVAAFLIPYLTSGELRMAAEATPSETAALRRLLPGFAEHFQVLPLPPLDRRRVLSLFMRMGGNWTRNSRIAVAGEVYDQLHRLFSRFYPYTAFPGRAAGFFGRVLDGAGRKKAGEITTDLVAGRFIRETGLPEIFLDDGIPLPPDDIFAALTAEVIGQDPACRIAAEVIATFKAGLNDPRRPVGVLLFCGPTGVGKTQLARSIAGFCFGHGREKDRLIRLDMSEYGLPGAADRLTGGSGREPGEMVRKIRRQPFSVLLLDEIEKAAPEVFDMLLGVLDEGRFTDPYGRAADFRSAIIIMTSNLGVRVGSTPGFGGETDDPFETAVRSFFRPEFFNRIDDVVAFSHLSPESIAAITRKELAQVAGREGLTRRNLKLTWTDRAVAHLAEMGYDRRYGARNLQRVVERRAAVPLARYLLENGPPEGSAVRLDVGDGDSGDLAVEFLSG